MGARDELSEHTWQLVLVVYATVTFSAATDICGFQRFAATLDAPAWAGATVYAPRAWGTPIRRFAFTLLLNYSG